MSPRHGGKLLKQSSKVERPGMRSAKHPLVGNRASSPVEVKTPLYGLPVMQQPSCLPSFIGKVLQEVYTAQVASGSCKNMKS